MKHVLFKLEGCPFVTLNDEDHIKFCLFHAAEASYSKVLKVETQKFVPQGVTGFALLAESHLSIHTWPEKGVAMCDIFTCGDGCQPQKAVEYLSKWLVSKKVETDAFDRLL